MFYWLSYQYVYYHVVKMKITALLAMMLSPKSFWLVIHGSLVKCTDVVMRMAN